MLKNRSKYQVKYILKTYLEKEGVVIGSNVDEFFYTSTTFEPHYIFKDLLEVHHKQMISGLEIIEISPVH